jgi:hypothetical protein
MPRLTPEQKELRKDKVVIRSEVAILRSPDTTAAAKAKAVKTISSTVMKTTDLSATDDRAAGGSDTPKLLANLATALDPGSVALSGIDAAIDAAAIHHPALKDVPKSELDSIPVVVRERLDKLV